MQEKGGSKKIDIKVEIDGEVVYVERRADDGKPLKIPVGKLMQLRKKRKK